MTNITVRVLKEQRIMKKDPEFIKYIIKKIKSHEYTQKTLLKNKYYIGSIEELYNKYFSFSIQEGEWNIYKINYNSCFIFYCQINNLDSKKFPEFSRETSSTSVFGFSDLFSIDRLISSNISTISEKNNDLLNAHETNIQLCNLYSGTNINKKTELVSEKSRILIYLLKINGYVVSILFIPSCLVDFITLEKNMEDKFSNKLALSDYKTNSLKKYIVLEEHKFVETFLNSNIEKKKLLLTTDNNIKKLQIITTFLKKYYSELPIYMNNRNTKYFIGTLHEFSSNKNLFAYNLKRGEWNIYQYDDKLNNFDTYHNNLLTTPLIPKTEKIIYGHHKRTNNPNLKFYRNTTNSVYFTNLKNVISPFTFRSTSVTNNYYIFLSLKKKKILGKTKKYVVAFLLIPNAWFLKYLNIEKNYFGKIENFRILNLITISDNLKVDKKNLNKNIRHLIINDKYKIHSENFLVSSNNFMVGSAEEMIKHDLNDKDNFFKFKKGRWKILHHDIYIAIHTEYNCEEIEYVFKTINTNNIGFADKKILSNLKKNKLVPKESTVKTQVDYSSKYNVYFSTNKDNYVTCCVLIPEKLLGNGIKNFRDKNGKYSFDTESSSSE